MCRLILLVLSLLIHHLALAEAVSIDETMLLKLSSDNNYQRKLLELESDKGQLDILADKARYQTQMFLKSAYADSSEEALIAFSPTLGPTNQLALGLQQQTGWGAAYKAEIFGEQISTADGTINRATRGGYKISLEMELLQNWLGSMDRDKVLSLNQQLRESEQYRVLRSNQLEYEIRKVYWSLVANDRSLQVTEQLLETAGEQLEDLKRRQQAGVASHGDVSRAKAQLESRKTSKLLLLHQKLQLEKALQQMVPELAGKSMKLSKVDYSKVSQRVLMCISKIKTFPEYEADWTSYSGILDAQKAKYDADIKQADKTAGSELTLQLQYQKSNADQNYDKAFSEEMKEGYGASLQLTIPLGSSDDKLRESQRALITASHDAETSKLKNLLQSEHQQINGSLELLVQGLAALERNNKFLNESVIDMQKKYRQARVGLPNLILEQETHFNSSMREIDVRLQVIQSLLNYFKVFNRFPCDVNHVRSAT